ncbi:hypothetical protein FIBSPDRAFT_939907 [Athelia psychrophila]|uniref:Uncharacterized protein n=1 Tax=Athelia psychrophila TaxID=1759441 RepID=A0A167WZ84_9AGAM|nr:hypothetical protein FIBSPDRAFT_939907 [Fibularhizoctonia sp. CBS 109695]
MSPLEVDVLALAALTLQANIQLTANATVTVTANDSQPASIFGLPNELLAAVFFAGLEDPFLSQGPREMPFETLISHVSHHWRSLAHNTPRLWTTIMIDTLDKDHLENTANYIQRSGALSLDVSVHIPYDHGQPYPTFPTLCRFLSAEVERLQMLRVESDAGLPSLEFFFENMPKSAPRLQALEIRLPGQLRYPPHIIQDSIFPDGMPNLNSLHLVGVSLQNTTSPQCPLTSLQLHNCAYYHSSVRGAVYPFSSLTHLILSELNSMHEWESNPFILPTLKGLYLRYLADYDKILSRIVAPALDTLYLEAVTEDEMANIIAVSHSPGTQSPKFPRLRSFMLRLAGRTLSYRIWQDFMEAFQHITHFTLLDSTVYHFLQPFSAPQVPWPRLEMLSLPNLEPRLLKCVMSAVVTRASMGHPILKLQLSPALFGVGESFWRARGVEVEVVADPRAALPAACRAEEWQDDEEPDVDIDSTGLYDESDYDYY